MEKSEAYEFLRNEINNAIPGKFKNKQELATAANVAQGNLNDFLNGKRNGLNFETAYKILQVIHNTVAQGQDAPTERIKESDDIVSFIKSKIGENKEFPRQIDMAKFLGLPQTQATKLYNFLNKQADTSYKDVVEWFIKLGGSFEFENNKIASITTIGSNTTREIKENDNIIYVPICSYAGAGAEVDYNAFTENELVPILKDFWKQDLRIVRVIGDSMEPTIKENSLVGVVPCSGNLKAGKVYLVNIPEFGHIIKRVYPGEKQGTILLSSDNKNHKDRTIDCKGYDNIIVAEIVWVLQIV